MSKRVRTLLGLFALAALVTGGVAGPATGAAQAARDRPGTGPVRMNEVQVIGTHNSYHRELSGVEQAEQVEVDPGAPGGLYYSHAALPLQLSGQAVRSFELDVLPDPDGGLYAQPLLRTRAGLGPLEDPAWREPGTKVFHIVDTDYNTTCVTLVRCLEQVREWSQANPGHVPIPIMLEFKGSEDRFEQLGGVESPPWDAAALDRLDAEIRSVFREDEIVTPDDLRQPGRTLEQSVLSAGWPRLQQARGQVMFLMDNDPGPIRDAYLAGHPNLTGRVLFTNSRPGLDDAAFIKRNEPRGAGAAEIQDLVRRGYYVRTRSDLPLSTVRSEDTTQLQAALGSGAQIVSTDFPAVGMAARYDSDFVAQLPGGLPVRCNPVLAVRSCDDARLERLGR